MAFNFIVKSIWNPFMEPVFEGYCKEFKELKNAHDRLNLGMKDNIELYKEIQNKKEEITRARLYLESVSKMSSLSREQKEQMEKYKKLILDSESKVAKDNEMEDNAQLTEIASLFVESFKHFPERLKTCDEKLFIDEKCFFLRHLETYRVWGNERMTEEKKVQFWAALNGAYLILEIILCIPEITMKKLEELISEMFETMMIKKQEFDKSRFISSAKLIQRQLDKESSSKIARYFWEFITSKFTPIYALVDQEYHYIVQPLLAGVQNERGRNFLLEKISPIVDDVKKRVGKTSIIIDEKTGDVKYDDEGHSDPKAEEKRQQERERLLECIIESVADVLSRNKKVVDDLINDHEKGFKSLMKDLIPTLITLAATSGIGGSNVEESSEEKKEREEKENKEFTKGAPTLRKKTGTGGAIAPPHPPTNKSGNDNGNDNYQPSEERKSLRRY